MARRWIRLDATWEDSEWLDALDGTAAGCWPRILCMMKRDGIGGRCRRPAPAVLARRWRVPVEAVVALEAAAIADGALAIEDDEWICTGWADYQDVDPTAAQRKRRERERKKATQPVTRDTRDTGRDLSCATETETETEETTVSIETDAVEGDVSEKPDNPADDLRAAIPPAVREHLWQSKTVPDGVRPKDWSMGREITIARQIVESRRATLDQLLGAIGVARSTLGLDGPLTLRIFNVQGRHDQLAVCVAAWQKLQLREKARDGDSLIGRVLAS